MEATSLETRTSCPVCGSSESRRRFDTRDRIYDCAGTFWIRACSGCHSLFVANPPVGEDMDQYYPPNYVAYIEEQVSLLRRIRRDVHLALFRTRNNISPRSWLTPILTALPLAGYVRGYVLTAGGRHLDIGCGEGQFLELSRSLGMDVYGVEPNAAAARAANLKGLRVTCGILEDGRFPARYFDLITMNHVFEHVASPRATLIEAGRILKPGGTLIIATPNANSLLEHLFGKYWFQLGAPRHLQIYTPDSISGLARTAHLRIASTRWIGHPVAVAGSLYNRLVPDGKHTPRTVLHRLLLSPPALWLSIVPTAITNAFHLGDTIEVRMTTGP